MLCLPVCVGKSWFVFDFPLACAVHKEARGFPDQEDADLNLVGERALWCKACWSGCGLALLASL